MSDKQESIEGRSSDIPSRSDVQAKLKAIINRIMDTEGWGNWEGNKVKNGPKIGYLTFSGDADEAYFSYKHRGWKSAASFSALQKGDGNVSFRIKHHDTDTPVENLQEKEAIDLFRKEMRTAVDSPIK